jgi:hypothetical protein
MAEGSAVNYWEVSLVYRNTLRVLTSYARNTAMLPVTLPKHTSTLTSPSIFFSMPYTCVPLIIRTDPSPSSILPWLCSLASWNGDFNWMLLALYREEEDLVSLYLFFTTFSHLTLLESHSRDSLLPSQSRATHPPVVSRRPPISAISIVPRPSPTRDPQHPGFPRLTKLLHVSRANANGVLLAVSNLMTL